jgi:hypothetical protein
MFFSNIAKQPGLGKFILTRVWVGPDAKYRYNVTTWQPDNLHMAARETEVRDAILSIFRCTKTESL